MDQQLLEKELEQLHPQSFGWALRCCKENREMAAEVLQNAYLKILEGKARFTGASTFRTWLFSVIRFTAVDYFRQQQSRKRRAAETTVFSEMSTHSKTENDQRSQLFKSALGQLSAQQQQVLHLVFYQNCTIREAAEIMAIQIGTARTHYQRGKEQLKQWLIKSGSLKDIY